MARNTQNSICKRIAFENVARVMLLASCFLVYITCAAQTPSYPVLKYSELEHSRYSLPYVRYYGADSCLLVYGSNHTNNTSFRPVNGTLINPSLWRTSIHGTYRLSIRTSLNRVNQRANHFRDQHMLSLVDAFLSAGSRAFLIVGGWHALVCTPAFTSLTEKPTCRQ